ncbi:hypothetical protein SK128_016395, partial [Halocaridina rubra]
MESAVTCQMARAVAFLWRTCFGRSNRYLECMPLLTSVRDGARTLDLPPQSRGRYHFTTENNAPYSTLISEDHGSAL